MSDENRTRPTLSSRTPVKRPMRGAAAAVLALLAALLLAACGGGSKSASSASASTSASASSSPRQQFAARAGALRACMQRNGVTLPTRKAGQPGGPLGGGTLPKGVTREQLRTALRKCGGGFGGARRVGGRNPQRLAKFAACMRQNGVKLPSANTSGKGPVFDTKGIDTTSATFKKADAKCASELFPSRGAAGAGAPNGAPGAGPPGTPGESPPAG